MRVGQKIRNIHTNKPYTIIAIESIKMDDGSMIAVYEISNENFDLHKFNANYTKHYEVITEE